MVGSHTSFSLPPPPSSSGDTLMVVQRQPGYLASLCFSFLGREVPLTSRPVCWED